MGRVVVDLQLQSTITHPHCGHMSAEDMPTTARQFFYDCKGCGELLRPKPSDCCVFARTARRHARPSSKTKLAAAGDPATMKPSFGVARLSKGCLSPRCV